MARDSMQSFGLLSVAIVCIFVVGGDREELLDSVGAYKSTKLLKGFSSVWEEVAVSREAASSFLAPRTVWAVRGGNAFLKCHLRQLLHSQGLLPTAEEQRNVTWLRNNKTTSEQRHHFVTPEGHLNITKASPTRRDGVEYRCVMASKVGVLSGAPILLKLADMREDFILNSSNLTVMEGESVRMACSIDSQPLAVLSWTRAQEHLPHDSRYITPISGVLQILNVQISDAGMYRCLAENFVVGMTQQSAELELKVLPKEPLSGFSRPTFLTSVTRVKGYTSQDVVIECLVSGMHQPTVHWERKLRDIILVNPNAPWELLDNMEGITTSGNSNLHIKNLVEEDIGSYACVIDYNDPETGELRQDSQDIELLVFSPPFISNPPSSKAAIVAQTVRMYCDVGDASTQVVWYKQGLPIKLQSYSVQRSPSELIITSAGLDDTGLYQCMAVNEAGYTSSWTSLKVGVLKDPPAPPKNLRFILLSPTSVNLIWDPVESESEDVVAYTVHISEVGGSSRELEAITTTNSCMWENLKPNTKYSFYVRSYTKSVSNDSKKLVFSTGEDVPIAAPKIVLQVLKPTALYVSWEELLPEDARGEIVRYKIQWRLPDSQIYKVHEVSQNEVGAGVHNYVIENLQPGKLYEVRVLAGTSKGYPDEAELPWIRQKMIGGPKDDYKLPDPPEITLDVLNSSLTNGTIVYSLSVSWEAAENDKADINGFKMQYRKDKQPWSDIMTFTLAVKSHIISNVDLDWYYIKIRAFNTHGEGKISIANIKLSGTIEKVAPPTVGKVKVEQKTGSSMQVSWTLPKEQEDKVKFYTVRYLCLDAAEVQNHSYVRSTSNSVVISSLKPRAVYEFSVRAHLSEKEYGPYSSPVQASTFDGFPDPPTQLNFKAIDASTIKVRVTQPVVKETLPRHFEIFYSPDKDVMLTRWQKADVMDSELESPAQTPHNPGDHLCNSTGHGDIQEMDMYVPMLTRIPPDFISDPLDTKGGYPDVHANGYNNPRCNGFVKSSDCSKTSIPPVVSLSSLDEKESLLNKCEEDINHPEVQKLETDGLMIEVKSNLNNRSCVEESVSSLHKQSSGENPQESSCLVQLPDKQ